MLVNQKISSANNTFECEIAINKRQEEQWFGGETLFKYLKGTLTLEINDKSKT